MELFNKFGPRRGPLSIITVYKFITMGVDKQWYHLSIGQSYSSSTMLILLYCIRALWQNVDTMVSDTIVHPSVSDEVWDAMNELVNKFLRSQPKNPAS